jgi:hypothetical protein
MLVGEALATLQSTSTVPSKTGMKPIQGLGSPCDLLSSATPNSPLPISCLDIICFDYCWRVMNQSRLFADHLAPAFSIHRKPL